MHRHERDEAHGRAATVAALRDAYREAVLDGALRPAERVIGEAIDAGLPEIVIDDEIITPAMRVVGDLWAAGELLIAEEHRASAISAQMVALQRERFRVERRRAAVPVLLAVIAGEHHTLGLRMAESALTHAGFDVRMLGDVSPAALAAAVEERRPAVLGLTAATAPSSLVVERALEAVRGAVPDVGLLVGGRAAAGLALPDPRVATCTHVSDAVALCDALAQRAALN